MVDKFNQSASKEEIDTLNKTVGTSGKAIVREVISGDYFKMHKTAGKDQFEANVNLAYINAPRTGNPSRKEEPFAHDAREFLREKLIGQKVDYTIEYIAGGRRFVSIRLEEKDLAS